MRFPEWAVAVLAALTVAGNAMGIVRFGESAAYMARTWTRGFRSTGEHVDAARRMAENAVSQGWSIAYCQPYEDRITSVDRSRILAMSWATAPCPVPYGDAVKLRGYDAVVASAYGFDFNSAAGLDELYRVVDFGGGLALWAKEPVELFPAGRMPPLDVVFHGLLATAALLTIVLVLILIRGMKCAIMGICAISIMEFLQVVCLHNIDRMWAGLVVMIVLAGAYCLNGVGGLRSRVLIGGLRNGLQNRHWAWIGAVVFIFSMYAVLALSHTFVAPTGLGTVGGKAKLMLLSKGFPRGFFTDPLFMLYQPPYPPGGALFLLLGYVLSGGCDEWLVQLVNCFLAALLLGFLLLRVSKFSARWLVVSFFVSPLTLRLVTLFYPEVLVGLCMLVGWDCVRRRPLDSTGWIVMGMSGWFKNEGLVYFCSMALPMLYYCPSGSRYALAKRILCAMALPIAWHVGCRLHGAVLDGYVPISEASVVKGFAALRKIFECAFCKPWLYSLAFPLTLVTILTRQSHWQLSRVAGMGAGISICLFCFIFSLSGAEDFAWHLDSVERLLWVPALLLLHAVTVRYTGFSACSPDDGIWYNILDKQRKGDS